MADTESAHLVKGAIEQLISMPANESHNPEDALQGTQLREFPLERELSMRSIQKSIDAQDGSCTELSPDSMHRSSFSTENSEGHASQLRRRGGGGGYASLQDGKSALQTVDRMSRWVKNLRVKSKSSRFPPSIYEAEENTPHANGLNAVYGKSFETSPTVFTSSSGFVNKMRTATASVASLSYYTGGDAASRRLRRDRHSRQASPSRSNRGSWDMATVRRAGERRKVMQEIISSEEIYIADLKALKSVYDHVTEGLETEITESRSFIRANILDLIELHERLLASILNSFPSSSSPYDVDRSEKNVGVRVVDILGLASGDGLAEPEAVMNICEIFGELLQKVFVYEEYAAHYSEMLSGFVGDFKACENWKNWESGFEMLANSLHSSNTKETYPGKKAVGLSDLIVKPIQRICKYQLMFEEMLKFSPVIDCPGSNLQLQRICKACKDTALTVNTILGNDQESKDMLRKTWAVRGLLTLERERHLFDGIWPDLDMDFYRKLGRLNMCSVLFVVWPSQETIKGSYMVCLLYKTYLMLANVIELQRYPSKLQFAIEFLIPLENAEVQDVKDGQGIQCANAPFSWKIQFTFNGYNYQVVLCARNMEEEREWRSQLDTALEKLTLESAQHSQLHHSYHNHRRHYSLASHMPSLSVIPLGLRYIANGMCSDVAFTFQQGQQSLRSALASSSISRCIIYIYNTNEQSETRPPGLPPTEFVAASPCDLSIDAIASLKFSNRETGLLSEECDALVYTLSPARHTRTKIDNLIASVWSRGLLRSDTLTKIKRLPSMKIHRTLTMVSGKSSSTDSGSTDGGTGLRKLSINNLSLRWGSKRRFSGRKLTSHSGTENCDTGPLTCDLTEPRPNSVVRRGRSVSYDFSSTSPLKERPVGGSRRVVSMTQPLSYTSPPKLENEIPYQLNPHNRRKSFMARISPEPLTATRQTNAECWSVGLSSKSITESEKDLESSNCSQPSLDKQETTSSSQLRVTSRAKDSLKRLLFGI